jgi:hypothetical protein
MCSVCIATAATIVAGVTSGGGLAALATMKRRGTAGAGDMQPTIQARPLDSEGDE